jgi:hypothetical protein
LKAKTRSRPQDKDETATADGKPAGSGASGGDALAELRERREKALADKIQLQTEILRGELVLREIVTSAIGGIYSIYRNQFLDVDLSQGDVLCAAAGIPAESYGEVRRILSGEAYSCVRETMGRITAFITGGGETEKQPRTAKKKTAWKK